MAAVSISRSLELTALYDFSGRATAHEGDFAHPPIRFTAVSITGPASWMITAFRRLATRAAARRFPSRRPRRQGRPACLYDGEAAAETLLRGARPPISSASCAFARRCEVGLVVDAAPSSIRTYQRDEHDLAAAEMPRRRRDGRARPRTRPDDCPSVAENGPAMADDARIVIVGAISLNCASPASAHAAYNFRRWLPAPSSPGDGFAQPALKRRILAGEGFGGGKFHGGDNLVAALDGASRSIGVRRRDLAAVPASKWASCAVATDARRAAASLWPMASRRSTRRHLRRFAPVPASARREELVHGAGDVRRPSPAGDACGEAASWRSHAMNYGSFGARADGDRR